MQNGPLLFPLLGCAAIIWTVLFLSSAAQAEGARNLVSKEPFCASEEDRTNGALNSCSEQAKCFSITYRKLDDPAIPCDDSKCDFQWKVCMDINKHDPCCNKKQKKAFQRACIRGNDMNSCLGDEVLLGSVDKISRVRFDEEYCEIVRPGENAMFQLVRGY